MVMFREQDVRNFGSVPGYGLTLHSIPWISFFESLNSIIRCTCSSNLHFPKNSIKWNKLTKYSKQFRKCTKFRHGVSSTVRGLKKKFGGQNTKKNWFAECHLLTLGKHARCRVPVVRHSAKCSLCRVFVRTLGKEHANFFFKKMFAECLSARHSAKW